MSGFATVRRITKMTKMIAQTVVSFSKNKSLGALTLNLEAVPEIAPRPEALGD
jgi:hypothetical protein